MLSINVLLREVMTLVDIVKCGDTDAEKCYLKTLCSNYDFIM